MHKSFRDHPEDHVFAVDEDACAICALVERSNRRRSAKDSDWDHNHPVPAVDAGLPARLKHAGLKRPGDGRHVYLQRLSHEQAAARAQAAQDRTKEG